MRTRGTSAIPYTHSGAGALIDHAARPVHAPVSEPAPASGAAGTCLAGRARRRSRSSPRASTSTTPAASTSPSWPTGSAPIPLEPFSMHAPLFPDREMGRAGAPACNLLHPEKSRRIDAMDEIKRALETAEHIHFRNLVVHLGERDDGWSQRTIEYAITALEHLGAFAHPLGVRLLVENLLSEATTPSTCCSSLRWATCPTSASASTLVMRTSPSASPGHRHLGQPHRLRSRPRQPRTQRRAPVARRRDHRLASHGRGAQGPGHAARHGPLRSARVTAKPRSIFWRGSNRRSPCLHDMRNPNAGRF